MQSASGGDDKKTERKEQKFEPVVAVPVIVDVSIRDEFTSRPFSFESVCPLSTDGSEMNETWLCMGLATRESRGLGFAIRDPYAVTCWDFEKNTMIDLTDNDFMVTSLKLALFQKGAGCQSIEINGIKYGMLAVDNKLIIFQATRDPSGRYSKLSPHLQRDIFRKDEEKEYFKRMKDEESGRISFRSASGRSHPEARYNRKVFPRKTEIFPDQQHVAIEYKGERIFIVGLSHDMSFSFAFPEGQRIDAFTVNKDGVLIAFPSVGKGETPPGYYFHVTVDFKNQTVQIEKILSTLSYERVAAVSCLSRDVLLIMSEEKEREENDPLTLSRVIIAAENKSISQDRILGKISSPKECIVLASGDVVYQAADNQMHVFDNTNKRTSSCPFAQDVVLMSLCRPRVIYFDGHFWSIPKFIDLKQALVESTPLTSDVAGLVAEYSVAGVDDGSREMALPASKSIIIKGATLMADTPIVSFNAHITEWRDKIKAIDTVDDLKKVINEALEQLNAILRFSKVDKLTGDFGVFFDALLELKAGVANHGQMVKVESLLSVEMHIVDYTIKDIWQALYRKVIDLPEIKERERVIGQEIRYQKIMDEKKRGNIRAAMSTGELMANDAFREIISNIKAGNPSIKTIAKWLDFVRMHLKLSARASTTNKKRPASLFVYLPTDEKKPSGSELSRIITQIAKLESEEKDKGKNILQQAAQLLVDFAKRDDCPGSVKTQIEELVGHIRHVQVVDRYKPSFPEEARILELFEQVIAASKEAKISVVHQTIVIWLEAGIAQIGNVRTSKGGLFDEDKEVVANLREFKGKMEAAHRLITITQLGLDEENPEPIKMISTHLSELAAYKGCPEKLKDQIGEVVRDLAKAFPARPEP